ncbi:MAG: hypothetical protein HAW59_04770, partial [Betaproteobacteria bacterium]|nr:hypothetical protein [Betaproteobacteria bacterium]
TRLNAAADDIMSRHADAFAVVVLGDIADKGDAVSYRLAARALSRLAPPVYLLPGNHDDRGNMRAVFSELPSGFMQQTFSTPAGDFVLLDSVRAGAVGGEYCARRAEWLRQTLRRARRPVFVCMHHPPLFVPFLQDAHYAPKYFRPLVEVIDEFPGKIRCYIFGHMHGTATGVWRGIPFSVLRSLGPQCFFTGAMPARDEDYIHSGAQPHYGILLAGREQFIFHHHGFLENIPA